MKKFLTLAILSLLISTTATAQTETSATTEETAVTTEATAPTETATPATTEATAETTTASETTTTTMENPLENTLYLELKDGKVVMQLLPELAPKHVERIKELARQGFYNGTAFHRVIDGFMAQTGDPTGTGTGGSGTKIDAEFNREKHVRGTVSMARAADPNSADSQFFIVFDEATHLDGNYTAFGKVTEGMEFVDNIKKGTGPNGMVSDPDKMISLKVAADVATTESKPAEAAAQ